MSLSMCIHPKKFGKSMALSANRVSADNSNAITLHLDDTTVSLFGLDDHTAQILSAVGRLGSMYRAELVPILEHMLDVQDADEGDDDA